MAHEVDTPDKEHLKNMGAMTALAIALHNFPEGLATFVAALADMKLGLALAVAVAVHNIPEGACVAMPVYYATGSRWKGFWWSFVSGVSEPIGVCSATWFCTATPCPTSPTARCSASWAG